MPNGKYKGQKLINDVRTNTAPSANSTIPTVPGIVSVNHKTANIAAITILIILSAVPMFFFILIWFSF